ncbi:ATP-binding cassette, subfamily B [Lachnospiraceae bacterium G11]|nr:ATP-binding cassette, subfamily B [Lachnospiraceae bacterium G11]
MLKKMFNLTDAGQRAVYKSGVWLAIFEVLAMVPMLLIIKVFNTMFESLKGNDIETWNLAIYVIIGTVIVIALYLSYRKMYKLKYISAAEENATLRMSVMDKLRRLPESFLSKHDLSDLTSTVMDDIGTIEGILANQLTEMIGGFLSILVTIVVLFFFNVKLTLALCVVIPVAAIAMGLSDVVSGRTHMKNRIIKVSISDKIQEYLENIKVLKTSGSIEEYQFSIKKIMRRLVPRLVLFEFLAGMCVATAYNVLRAGIGIVAVYGISLLIRGEISIPVFVGFMLMSVWVYEPLSYTCEYLGAVIASKVAATRIKNITEYEEQSGDKDIPFGNYDIVFDNVSFGYEKDEQVLREVDFTAKKGEYTALVGASGCGKSTICKLAARLWDVDSGSIRLGNSDIKDVAPENLFKLYSIVFQDVTLFNDTIYNNILIGNKNATREQVLKAAEDAQCMSFIDKLPEGIDTVIGENGHTLSGGERQRLSIARAFLKDAPIVLLDESTASIDPETETKIQAAIERLTSGRTVLMIAHRLRSIVNCDRIIVLDEGRVVGNGTHKELMETCEVYKKLYTLQCESENI